MPNAPTPVKGDQYLSPTPSVKVQEKKTQVKRELGPKQTNMPNPKKE